MEPVQNKSYWNAAGMSGIVFGFIVFLISLIGNYMSIYTEPTGSLLSGSMMASGVGCLIGAFAGVMAVKLFINEYGPELKIGKGAVIGLITGLCMALIYQLLSLIWPVIDSSYIENLQTAMITNFEMMDQIPEEQRRQMIDSIYNQMQNYHAAGSIIQNLIFGFLTFGMLNLLSGLLSAKYMGTTPESEH